MTCFIAFLPYLPLSLSWPLTAFNHDSWRWGWGSLSTLSLLHLILSSSFPFCFISCNLLPHSFSCNLLPHSFSCNLLPHSFPVGTLFGSVLLWLCLLWFDSQKIILCLSLLLVRFGFTKFLSLMTSIKLFLLDFLKCKEFSLSSLHWCR